MSIYDLKPRFQDLLRPLSARCAELGISANAVTLSALVLSFVWGYFLLTFSDTSWVFLFLPVVLLVRMALNAMDGIIAREYGTPTLFGAYFNEVGDIAADIAIYIPLIFAVGMTQADIWLMSGLITLTELSGMIPLLSGKKRSYVGPMGKSDRAFAFSLIALLYCFIGGGTWLHFGIILIGLTMIITILNRLMEKK
jgi:CDP-diacylglycerol--glycerol-3-phosphate 3-phosphatidyltransferase